ncbi:MAG: hypothetical protein H7061_10850 [Bdellovibrionaceae bacterium]|nr:hypothetical protein [Bdellovibrio sp.]
MDFAKLVGQQFKEQDFYDLLLEELEDNFESNFGINLHFYFETLENNIIKVIDLCYFESCRAMNIHGRTIIEKSQWFEIGENENHMNLLLVRLDRTGFLSAIWRDKTRTTDWEHGWADEGPPHKPMTPEEIKEAFQELMGVMKGEILEQDLKKKRSA